jgi:preprotein translocase subunit SecY
VIPVIFASSLLIFPQLILGWCQGLFDPSGLMFKLTSQMNDAFSSGNGFMYVFLYVSLTFFFCFFWTQVVFSPVEMSKRFREYGTFIPGIRPGKKTAEYLDKVMTRVTLAGAAFLAFIAILPLIITFSGDVQVFSMRILGGTGILIVVGVALDMIQKIESHLVQRNYDGFMESGKIRGRGR